MAEVWIEKDGRKLRASAVLGVEFLRAEDGDVVWVELSFVGGRVERVTASGYATVAEEAGLPPLPDESAKRTKPARPRTKAAGEN